MTDECRDLGIADLASDNNTIESYGYVSELVHQAACFDVEDNEENQAFIYGKDIHLDSDFIQNINPYSVIVPSAQWSTPEKALDSNIANQVQIVAEENLVISSKGVIRNTSSIIEASNIERVGDTDSSGIYFKSRGLINDRYRVYVSKANHKETSSLVIYKDEVITHVSPAGRIISGGKLVGQVDGSFENRISWINVFDNMEVELDSFTQLGLRLSKVYKTKTKKYLARRYCARKVFGKCIKRKTRYIPYYEYGDVQSNEMQLPSFMDVGGVLMGYGPGKFQINSNN